MRRQFGYLKENKARFIAQCNSLALPFCAQSVFCVLLFVMAEGVAFPEVKLLTAAAVVNRLLHA